MSEARKGIQSRDVTGRWFSQLRSAWLAAVALAVCSVPACTSEQGTGTSVVLPGSSWAGERIAGDTIPTAIEITLTFGDDGRLHGSAGCNRYFSPFELGKSSLKIGPIGATKKLCPEPRMTAERRYLAALERVDGWAMKGGKLVFHGTGAELTFAKVH